MAEGTASDWPQPEPMQAPLPPEVFARVTRMEHPTRPSRASSSASAAARLQTAEEWPSPEDRGGSTVGDFTQAPNNAETLSVIAEQATLRNSRRAWQMRDYGQWKPAPMSLLAPIVASLIAVAIALIVPLFVNLDVIAASVEAAWEARGVSGQQMADVFVAAAGTTVPWTLLAAAAALWHLWAGIGVARGSRASLLAARAASAFWFAACGVAIAGSPGPLVALSGPTAVLWALAALMVAVFALTWTRNVQEWCRKILRAAD